jgi:hypothetical protein
VALLAHGEHVATATCDQPRPDLLTLGAGDGTHGFRVRIPRVRFPAGAGASTVQLRDLATGQIVGEPVTYAYEAAPTLSPLPVHLERVQEEGLVNGWCWDPDEPGRRVHLVVLVDGQVVGRTTADLFRDDLKTGGVGDGAHAFRFLLPWEVIADKSSAQVTLGDAETGLLLAASAIFRRHNVRPVEERLRDLERQMRLLTARLDDANRRASHDAAVVSGVLATIGAFFTRLSETALQAVPTALVPSLADLVDSARARLPPLSLTSVAHPQATFVITAAGTIDDVHACLTAIHAAELDADADIVLVDDGTLADAALLPALVANMRYWRLPPGQSLLEARNALARLAEIQWLVILSPTVRPTRAWWAAVMATFARHPDCAVLGTKLVRPDGTIGASGLKLDEYDRLRDFAQGELAAHPPSDRLQAVIGVSDSAMVVRARSFLALGGFDASFTDAGAAAIAFCLRCWEDGQRVLYQPAAELVMEGEAAPQPALAPALAASLAQRWVHTPHPAWPHPIGQAPGQALVLSGSANAESGFDPAPTAAALLALGWDVHFAALPSLKAEDAASAFLRGLGVQVWRAPFHPSVAAAMAEISAPFGLIVLSANALPHIAVDRLRLLAPDAQMVLVLNGVPNAPQQDAVAACDVAVVPRHNLKATSRLPAFGKRTHRRLLAAPQEDEWLAFYRNLLAERAMPGGT